MSSWLLIVVLLFLWLVYDPTWSYQRYSSGLVTRYKPSLLVPDHLRDLCLIFVYDWTIKNWVICNNLVSLLKDAVLCCSDGTDHDRLLMRPIVKFLVHILLPGSIIHRLTRVIIVLAWAYCNFIALNVDYSIWFIEMHLDDVLILLILILRLRLILLIEFRSRPSNASRLIGYWLLLLRGIVLDSSTTWTSWSNRSLRSYLNIPGSFYWSGLGRSFRLFKHLNYRVGRRLYIV